MLSIVLRFIFSIQTVPNCLITARTHTVKVFADVDGVETNVALESRGASAKQSTTYSSKYPANKALNEAHIDGQDDCSHSKKQSNPWW